MKRAFVWTVAVALVLLPAASAMADSWTGWITDSHCGAKGARAGHEACAKKCVHGGSTYVFYNNADQKIYKVSDQKMAEEALGHEVVVTGTLDNDTITVQSIKPAGG